MVRRASKDDFCDEGVRLDGKCAPLCEDAGFINIVASHDGYLDELALIAKSGVVVENDLIL